MSFPSTILAAVPKALPLKIEMLIRRSRHPPYSELIS